MSLTLRPVEADDERAILVLCHRFRRQWAELNAVLGPVDERMFEQVYRGVVMSERGAGWLVFDEDEPVGLLLVALVPNLLTGETSCDELVWWVDERHRKGSAGGRLLRAAVDWARRNGAVLVKLVTPYGSEIGVSLARHGYLPVEVTYVRRL
jgi:RimJ/RimL family protein N-acetyltransferase